MSKIRKEYSLIGLGCPNCAAKMEKGINMLSYVKEATIAYATKTLIIEAEDHDEETLTKDIENIVQSYEPEVKVREKNKYTVPSGIDDKRYYTDKTADTDSDGKNPDPDEDEDEISTRRFIIQGIGTVIFVLSFVPLSLNQWAFAFLPQISGSTLLLLISYLLIGYRVLFRALRNIIRGELFDENFLMSLATVGALAIGQYPEAVSVMLFYEVGELFQDKAVQRSRRSIQMLLNIKPEYANLLQGSEIIKISPEQVKYGDIIVVKPGERIPLDGIVKAGISFVDMSALTGESIPQEVEPGSEVLSGSINTTSLLEIKVSKEYRESTVARILDLVQNAAAKKAPTENFITTFAHYYTPAVVIMAAAIAFVPPLIWGSAFAEWINRALVFLVVSCPCALVISIPLGFFGGIGASSKKGILVKGGSFLEALNRVDTVVFDKTGTLTKGIFEVEEIVPHDEISKEKLLEYTALAEHFSNHPLATAISRAYPCQVSRDMYEEYFEIPGRGIKAVVNGTSITAGNIKLMKDEGISIAENNFSDTAIHVAVNGKYAGFIRISDQIKPEAKQTISDLKEMGIRRIVMLSGDHDKVVQRVGRELGMDEVYSELLPEDKVHKIEELDEGKPANKKIVFVGDGINDAPVLARADIGVAMGAIGSDAAVEAADIVLMNDEPSKLVQAIKIARRTHQIVWQNIFFALGVKGVVLILGALGMANMWEAVFADVGVALIAVLNATRVLGQK